MRIWRGKTLLLTALWAATAYTSPNALRAVEAPIELQWHQLVPPAPPKPPRSFLAGRSPVDLGKLGGPDDGTLAPPPLPEGRWMSTPARKEAMPAPLVESLGGKRVHIGGYVV